MINTIKRVIVGGVSYPFYSVDFSGGGSEPSKMTISFVNEGGKYVMPELSSVAPVTITIGGFFSFTGYAVSASKREGVSGKFLEVTYVDSSIILDEYFVGLKGKHGAGFTSEVSGAWDKLILVGTEIDPCNGNDTVVDLCSPCVAEDTSINDLDCAKNRQYKILDVDYSLQELLSELSKFIPIKNIPGIVGTNYRAQYTGSVREVLNSWASDYGWTFFWDGDGVSFVDLSNGIQIRDAGVESGCSLEEKVESISIEENQAQVNIAYFGQDGELKDYPCANKNTESARKVLLKPLTLEDVLVKNGRIDPFISNNYVSSLNFEKCAALSMYSELARDLFCLYYIYQITTAVAAEAAMNEKRILKLLGNLEIVNVCHPDSSDNVSKAIYSFYLTKGSENTPYSDAEIDEFIRRGAYFVVAKTFNSSKSKFIEFEKALAENCIGKYWYRYFDTVYQNGVDFSAPDGQLSYYKRGSAIQFDFLDSLPDSLGSLSSFLQEIQSSTNGAKDNFFLLERNQAWMPPPNGGDITTTFNEDIQSIGIREAEKNGVPDNLLLENYKVFIMFPKNDTNLFDVGDASYTINPVDATNINLPFEEFRSQGFYGLRTAKTRGIPVRTKRKSFEIIMPSQGGFTPSVNYGGYNILVKGKFSPDDLTVQIPKVEIVIIDKPTIFKEYCIGNSVNYKNITDYNLSTLSSKCTIDKSRIYTYAGNLLNGLKSSPSRPVRSITYSLAGLPTSLYTLTDGLTNFSIRLDSGGTKTTLTFSEQPPRTSSETLTKNQIEFFLKNPVYKKYIQTYIKQLSVNQKIAEI